MTHDRAQDLLLELAYGELQAGDAREVERHVAECGACAAEWERIAATRRAMAALGDEPPGDGRRAAVLEAARAAAAAPRPRRLPRTATWTLAATTAVALVVAGVTLTLSGDRPVDRAPKASTGRSPPVAESAPALRAPEVRAGAAPGERATVARREEPSDEGRAPAARAERPAAATPQVSPAPRALGALAQPISADPRATAAAVERLIAGGKLRESSRRVICAGVTLDEVSWADGDQVLKISLTAPGGTLAEGWYDRQGRLRAARALPGGGEQAAASRYLDESGGTVVDERGGSAAAEAMGWLARRDPGSALADGCTLP